MKKILALVLTLVLACVCMVAFAACTPSTYEIALITDVGNIDDKSFNEGAWNGVKEYAIANNISYQYYRPIVDSDEARVDSIENAIDRGAKVVVCPGFLFETAIYQVQDKYPEVMFLLLDGEPHDVDYNYKTSANVHCILYQEEQAGYLAGYAAVKDGYKKLGFAGGMAVPAVIRFGYGYIQGAEAAATELNLDDVEVKYYYTGVFAPSDDIKIKMDGWYSSGTEVVFACGGGLYISVVQSANGINAVDPDANKAVIGVDVDQFAAIGESVFITSAMKDLTVSVKLALGELYANNGVWGAAEAGITAKLGAAVDGIGLPTADASWRFSTFTVAEYQELFAKLVDGTVVVNADTAAVPTVTKISLIIE